MRVEQQQQQNGNIIDILQQSIGPEEREQGISFLDQFETKSSEAVNGKSVNMKDATYLKPEAEEKKTVVEEIEESASLDATERKNQMAVLSNTTSEEDYARMQEDGFSLDSTTMNVIVTETDKIKAQLAKAGVDISIFGDDLDMEQLEAVTGSTQLAISLAGELRKMDLPLTRENLEDAMEALSQAGALQMPGAGAIKYMLDNQLEPTIENLYRAEFCGSSNYRSEDVAALDISSFTDQIERVIQQSGQTVDEQSMADSRWLLENDIALTSGNLNYLAALKSSDLPMDADAVMEQMAKAIAEGKRPQEAQMIQGFDLATQAEHALEVVTEATDEDLQFVIGHEMDLTIRSLEYAIASRMHAVKTAAVSAKDEAAEAGQAAAGAAHVSEAGEAVSEMETMAEAGQAVVGAAQYTEQGLTLLTARRQLEEVRLAMTAQANYSLLKQGISIDTEPLVKLVEELKENENQYYENLLKSQGVEASRENVALFRETTEKVEDIKTVPAYVLGMKEAGEGTINAVHTAGTALKDTFEKANERYETLMTAPRADLGDSIQKAFGNVDDILQDIGLETSEQNRRAVRILGYNELDITAESVALMKSTDEEVQRTFRNMTPAVVTQMIRQGINPLDMDFASLNATAEELRQELGNGDTEKFSEFLWKLEKNNAISEEERQSYIGIYRLIHQVEETDGAAVGALVNQGAEITMRNLMMAVRSERRGGKMDYSVDDSFGGSGVGGYNGTSITDQVEASYQSNCLKDVTDVMTPEKMRLVMEQVPDWENMTPEQFAAALKEAETDDASLDNAYAREQLAELAESAKADGDIYAVLQKYDIPNTMANVLALQSMANNRNRMFRQIFGDGTVNVEKNDNVKDTNENTGAADGAEDLEQTRQDVLEEFINAVSSPEEMAEAQEKLDELAENVMNAVIGGEDVTSIDVREMRLLSTQLSVTGLLAKEEQYSVPVLVSDGVVNVSLKIVRGEDQKGIVDITMESEQRGKIAATFQAKGNGVDGLLATDNRETKALLEENGSLFTGGIAEEGTVLHYAYIDDLDLNHFSMGMFGVDADSKATAGMFGVDADEDYETGESGEKESHRIQTTRLYHIAESFIRTIRDVL